MPAGEISSGKVLQNNSPELGLDHRVLRGLALLGCNYIISVVTHI